MAQGMQQLDDQLSELEMLQQDLASLDAAQQELDAELAKLCESLGECEGSGMMAGKSDKYSNAPPRPGQQGRGAGAADEAKADYKTAKTLAST